MINASQVEILPPEDPPLYTRAAVLELHRGHLARRRQVATRAWWAGVIFGVVIGFFIWGTR